MVAELAVARGIEEKELGLGAGGGVVLGAVPVGGGFCGGGYLAHGCSGCLTGVGGRGCAVGELAG